MYSSFPKYTTVYYFAKSDGETLFLYPELGMNAFNLKQQVEHRAQEIGNGSYNQSNLKEACKELLKENIETQASHAKFIGT